MSYENKIYCKLQDILVELQNAPTGGQVVCVEENSNLYLLQYSDIDQTYHVFDFAGNDVTGTVTPTNCDAGLTVNVTANGVMVPDTTTFTLPTNISSVAISAQTGTFDISFDGGVTWALTDREGVREFGDGSMVITNSDQIVIASHGNIDIIREII